MELLISAILKKLSDKFVPDLSISRNLTSDEARCYSVIEKILLSFAEGVFVDEVEEYVSCSDDDSQSEDSTEDLSDDPSYAPELPCKGNSIESRFSQRKMDDIWHHYQEKGSLSAQKKFRIKKSDVRQLKRHYEEGLGEHEKYRRIRQYVGRKFAEVSSFD